MKTHNDDVINLASFRVADMLGLLIHDNFHADEVMEMGIHIDTTDTIDPDENFWLSSSCVAISNGDEAQAQTIIDLWNYWGELVAIGTGTEGEIYVAKIGLTRAHCAVAIQYGKGKRYRAND